MNKLKVQVVTKPSNKNSSEIIQSYGHEYGKYKTLEIYSGLIHNPNFERLRITANGSPCWVGITIERIKKTNGKKSTLRRTSESITIDKKQAEQMIKNLTAMLEDLKYVEEI